MAGTPPTEMRVSSTPTGMGETEEEAVGVVVGGEEGVMALALGESVAKERVGEAVEEREGLAAELGVRLTEMLCVEVWLMEGLVVGVKVGEREAETEEEAQWDRLEVPLPLGDSVALRLGVEVPQGEGEKVGLAEAQ